MWSLEIPIAVYLVIICRLTGKAEEHNCKNHTVSLTGGGSSLAASVYTELGAMYSAKRNQEGQKVEFSYKSRNSGYGLGRITNTIPDEPPIVFGASDKTMSEKQSMLHRKLITFPTVAGALLVIYNLPEGDTEALVLSGEVLAQIYRGKITHWDDRQIEELNEGINFTHNRIRLTVRSDNSGETFIFTSGLSKFDRVWNNLHGAFSNPKFADGICCNSMNWPHKVDFFANGVHGMIGIIGSIPYTIGYASAVNVFESTIVKYVYFINKAMQVNTADQTAVQAAMDYYIGQPRPNPIVFDLNNALAPDAYPLASFSYIVVNRSTHEKISCCQMQELVGFVQFLLNTQSSLFTKHYLVPLTPLMVSLVMEEAVQTIRCRGELSHTAYKESLKPQFKFEMWNGVVVGLIALLLVLASIIVIYAIKVRKADKSTMKKWLLTGRVIFNVGSSDSPTEDNQASTSSQNHHHRKFFYTQGEFDGIKVMLDKLNINRTPEIWNQRTQMLVNSLREDVMHNNIINLLGIAEIDGISHAVVEYTSKGTLHYVLQTSQYDINDSIKYNLALNVSEGLAFLHRKEIVHSQLSSINCYLNGGWTLKIAGWYQFKMLDQEDPQQLQLELALIKGEKEEDLIKLMYMDPNFVDERKTSSDIFSMGLLWVEIFTKKLPFNDCSESFIQEKFYKSADIMKSKLNLDGVPSNIKPLIGTCVGPKDDRPSANALSEIIGKLRPSSRSTVDVMIESIEKYSSTLASKVDELAGQLTTQAEQLTTVVNRLNDVFNGLLPSGIASKLLRGEPNIPEHHECVTICSFSIHGINQINHSEPIERVALMNDLSTLIDMVIGKFDITKVYTIGGGGYIVCSGLLNPSKINHSLNIADFSIALLEAMADFKMRHLPAGNLSIKSGIDSGTATSGIIGYKVPQYCIFGPTVNMASLMENTSEPTKIQVSENTCDLLNQHRPVKYKLQLRHETEILGQLKSQKTFWLSKNIVKKKMPELPNIEG